MKTKRFLSTFLVMAMVLSLLPSITFPAQAAELPTDYWTDAGNYEPVTPSGGVYYISSAAQLAWVAYACNSGFTFEDCTVFINNSIDLSAHLWKPIGNLITAFNGKVQGNGFLISGLTINSENELYGGLFGKVLDTEIIGVGVQVSINAKSSSKMYIGGLAGYIENSNVNLCYVTGSISVTCNDAYGFGNVGGLIGEITGGGINRCYSKAGVSAIVTIDPMEDNAYIGGLAGAMRQSVIYNCYASGDVTSSDGYTYAGGLFGRINIDNLAKSIHTSYYSGTVSGAKYNGAIAGFFSNESVDFSAYYNSDNTPSDEGETNIINATGMSANDMKTTAFVGTLNTIVSVWTQISGVNNDYPVLVGVGEGYVPSTYSVSGTVSAGSTGVTELSGITINLYASTDTAYATALYTGTTGTGGAYTISGVSNGTYAAVVTASAGRYAQSSSAFFSVSGANVTTGADITLKAETAGGVWDGSKSSGLSGSGTSTDPFLITSGADLAYMAQQINVGDTISGVTASSAYYKLTADIVLNENASNYANWGTTAPSNSWTTIGIIGYPFSGTFDGNGRTVSGLYISTSSDYQGLFGFAYNCMIKDLGIVDSYIRGGSNVGGLAGSFDIGTAQNCYYTGSVSGVDMVGGVVGANANNGSILKNCHNTGHITGSGILSGGVAGYNNGKLESCYNTGSVSGTNQTGGVSGNNNPNAKVESCYNTGSVSGTSKTGGVTGTSIGTLQYCYNAGSVSGTDYVGGVAGENSSSLSCCYNLGVISGTDYIGGIAGNNKSTLLNSYNAGSVSGSSYVGGIIGNNVTTMRYCYNVGSVSGTSSVGSVAGESGTMIGCYNDKQMCAVGAVNGSDSSGRAEGKLTTEIAVGTAFSGWDSTIWNFTAGLYPMLTGYVNATTDYKMDKTDAAYVSVSPISLSATDTAASVKANFTVSTANGVSWASGNTGIISVSGTAATLAGSGSATLTASLNGVSKAVTLKAENSASYSVSGTVSAGYTGVTELSGITINLYASTDTAYSTALYTGATVAGGAYTISGVADGSYIAVVAAKSGSYSLSTSASFTVSGANVTTGADIMLKANVWDGSIGTSLSGSGTSADPFLISSGADLAYMAQQINAGGAIGGVTASSAYYRLTADIVLNENASNYANWGASAPSNIWTAIGKDSTNCFAGTFDGDGHTVSGLYINTSSDFQGLFGYIKSGSTVKNVGVLDSYVKGGSFYSGGVAGLNKGTIQNCYNAGSVSGGAYVGGVAGDNNNGGTLENCYNTGSVNGTGGNVGGVAGSNTSGMIRNCNNMGSVSGGNDINTGGVTGYSDGTLQNCYNVGSVSGSNNNIGGIIGLNGGTLKYCYNMGSISGSYDVGGVAGKFSEGTVSDCYNAGTLSGTRFVGGVTGINDSSSTTLSRCYNAGAVSGIMFIGGVTGVSDGTVTGCYYDKQMCVTGGINGSDSIGSAEGKLTSDMTVSTAFSGWDSSVWTFTSGLYPRLAGMDTTDAAYVSVSPVSLSAMDTASSVRSNFTVNTTNGVSWASNNAGIVSVSGSAATLAGSGSVTLTALLNSVSKVVGLTASNTPSVIVLASGSLGTAGDGKITGLTTGMVYKVTVGSTVYYVKADGTLSASASDAAALTGKEITGLTNGTTYKVEVYTTGGGGSGGSGDYIQETDKGAKIEVGGKTQTAGTVETKTQDGKTITTVTISTDKLKSILDSAGSGATVTIPITTGSSTASGKLDGQAVKDMEKKDATLVIKTGSASYTLPASDINIDSVTGKFGNSVSLSDITVNISISTPSDATAKVVANAAVSGGFSIQVPAVEFTVSCTYGGQTVEVSTFNSYVERMIAIPNDVDPNKITTGIVVEPDGIIHHVPTEVVVINGKYYAKINSLTNSVYSVIYNPVVFSDVEDHWAKDSINNMGSRLVVNGVGNNNYDPDRSITRAEFAAIMVKALGLEPGTGTNSFNDVNESAWYCGYIETASSYGIIKGYSENTFGPNDTITREQAMAMMARAMKITGLEVSLTDSDISSLLTAYPDGASAADYAKGSIAACIKAGIVSGTGKNIISPKDCVTRAEVAVMAERLLQKSGLI